MAAGNISEELFGDYCYNVTGAEYKSVEALRLSSSGVGLLSSMTTIAFVLIGHECAKIVHRFFLYYGTLAALLSASQLMMALSCRPASEEEVKAKIYSVASCTSCYFRFALYLLTCWISLYTIVIGACNKNKQAFKRCPAKMVAISAVLGIPLSCAWGPAYAALNCRDDRIGAERCKITYYSVAAAFASAQSLAHVACAAMVIVVVAILSRGPIRHHKKIFAKLMVIIVAMLVALLIFAVDLTVTVATLVSKLKSAGLRPGQQFYLLDALPLLGTVLVPPLYFCLVCNRGRFRKNNSIREEHSATTTSWENQTPKPERRASQGV